MNTIDWNRLALFAKIMKHVEFKDNGCWIYNDAISRPQIRIGGKLHPVTRIIYSIWYGVKLECQDLRHMCSYASCFNPEHLVPGTHHDNMLDMIYPPIVDMIKRLEQCGFTVTKTG